MRSWPAWVGFILVSCGGEAIEPEIAPTFTIDASRVTVSGVSSGAYMAGQLHVAHSALFSGAGLIAGGPYWCASGSMKKGLGPCMQGGELELGELQAFLQDKKASGAIDAPENLADDAVWIFHGTGDTIVNADVSAAARSFYESHVGSGEVRYVDDVIAVHGFPTISVGVACDSVATPFLNACDYDAAGEMLRTLYGELNERVTATGELVSIPQPGFEEAEMLDTALLYVPTSCATGETCGVHVAFHGCQQSVEFIGDSFAAGAGYNEWAESNNLLVLYPQVAGSKIAPLNPLGCWDWWGYTGEDYAVKAAPQIQVIKALLDSIAGEAL